jgi:hypothetical protein
MRSAKDRRGRWPSLAILPVPPRHQGKVRNRSATSLAGLRCPLPLWRPANIRPIRVRGWPVDRHERRIDKEPAVNRSPLHYAPEEWHRNFVLSAAVRWGRWDSAAHRCEATVCVHPLVKWQSAPVERDGVARRRRRHSRLGCDERVARRECPVRSGSGCRTVIDRRAQRHSGASGLSYSTPGKSGPSHRVSWRCRPVSNQPDLV